MKETEMKGALDATAREADIGVATFETRPWKIQAEEPNCVKAGLCQGCSGKKLGSQNILFTRNKASTVNYALVLY